MKKTVFISISCILCLFLVFSLCACSGSDKIVGEWKYSSWDMSYGDNSFGTDFAFDSTSLSFNKDGTVVNGFNETAVWKYDKKAKEYIIADSWDDKDLKYAEKAYIDKNGDLHVDCIVYKKVK